jgi:selenide, water dikinase
MHSPQTPIVKDLVLLGGGHSHLAVLRRFGMRPLPGVRLTLVTRDVDTAYSGMLPGFIAGHYGYDDCHIDLRPLAHFAGARLYHATATSLDLHGRRVLCDGRPAVPFDLLSIDTGSVPAAEGVPGASRYALPVKPVERFLRGWEAVVEQTRQAPAELRIGIVGGGAGGVELALSAQHRLRTVRRESGRLPDDLRFHLVTDHPVILPTHNPRVRNKFRRILEGRGVRVHAGSRVVRVEPDRLVCASGQEIAHDVLLWVTNAAAPPWIRESGLATDESGFVKVDAHLQSLSHPGVFAAGDVAAMVESPRPKSGVFAVRQGPPLARNLCRAAQGQRLKPFRPQRQFLSLIGTGDCYAVASRARWSVEGRWVWRLKDWIDRRFMARYNDLPEMVSTPQATVATGVADADALREISALAMRCGGCGAKVGSTVLSRVLARLEPAPRGDILVGLEHPDDAAVVSVPPGRLLVHTVDFFRAMLDDPFVFGGIAANHSLGDLYAMGAEPQTALAVATVPYGLEAKVEEQLYQLLAGACGVLRASATALVGGHTSEGLELAFGLAVNGLAEPQRLLRKGGMRCADHLILTKPLGTGTLFAADMRRRAAGRWIDNAIACMLQSSREASAILQRHEATACTDVTGFGLLGHLLEMIRASDVDAVLDLESLPVLQGALETLGRGIFSSLQPQNVRLRRAIAESERLGRHPLYPLLFDPQTAGGLLASVPPDRSPACLTELREAGYPQAAVIGEIVSRSGRLEPIVLRTAASAN